MKTKPRGKSSRGIYRSMNSYIDTVFSPLSLPSGEALQHYKASRENGEDQDAPKNVFPSASFEALKIEISATCRSYYSLINDPKPRSWKLILDDSTTNEDFAFEHDNVRGNPDKSDPNRYCFIIHGPNGVKMEGFSWEADREKGFPDVNGNYWRYVQYTKCGPIKEWMQEKDLRHLDRSVKFSALRQFAFS